MAHSHRKKKKKPFHIPKLERQKCARCAQRWLCLDVSAPNSIDLIIVPAQFINTHSPNVALIIFRITLQILKCDVWFSVGIVSWRLLLGTTNALQFKHNLHFTGTSHYSRARKPRRIDGVGSAHSERQSMKSVYVGNHMSQQRISFCEEKEKTRSVCAVVNSPLKHQHIKGDE